MLQNLKFKNEWTNRNKITYICFDLQHFERSYTGELKLWLEEILNTVVFDLVNLIWWLANPNVNDRRMFEEVFKNVFSLKFKSKLKKIQVSSKINLSECFLKYSSIQLGDKSIDWFDDQSIDRCLVEIHHHSDQMMVFLDLQNQSLYFGGLKIFNFIFLFNKNSIKTLKDWFIDFDRLLQYFAAIFPFPVLPVFLIFGPECINLENVLKILKIFHTSKQ